MLVKRKMRTKLLGIAGTIGLCAATVGTYLAVPASAEETRKLPLSAVVGNVSDGVTVSTAKAFTVPGVQVANENDEAGNVISWKSSTINALALSPASDTQEWSAEINATFTGNTLISYAVGMYTNEHKSSAANAFTVKNADGEEVARFVIANSNVDYGGWNGAYVYNSVDEKYTTCNVKWSPKYNTSIYESTDSNTTLTPSKDEYLGLSNWANSFTYLAPTHARGNLSKINLSEGDGTGTVYFEYADGVLSVKTSTYKVNGRDDHAEKSGNGQILTMGKINADLSKGYTITIGSAPAVGEYTYASTAMYITKINEFSTAAAEAEAAETKKISYYNETDDGKIFVSSGEKLARFDFITEEILTDENGKTLTVGNSVEKFEFDGNKAFTAEEEISVSHGGVSKNYTVVPNATQIDVTSLVGAVSEGVKVKASQSVSLKGTMSDVVTGLSVSPSAKTEKWNADLNGTFNGNTSIKYYLPTDTETHWTANAFTVKNTLGETVGYFCIANKEWQYLYGTVAYVYNASTKVFTSQISKWNGTVNTYIENAAPTVLKPINSGCGLSGFGDDRYISPKIGNQVAGTLEDGEDICGTVYFEYADNKLTIKTSTYKIKGRNTPENVTGNGQILTLGIIEGVDLSDGYRISVGSAPDIQVSDTETFSYPKNSTVMLVAINGIDVAGTTAQTTAVNEKIVAKNANVDENGVIVLNKGETPVFESQSTYALGSLQIGAASAVKTRVYGSISDFGDTAVITAIDAVGRKDFDVRVKTLSESIANSGMIAGASIRAAEPYGIRFAMNLSDDDYALIANEVGEGKAYVSVKYGMMILPYSYLSKYGELTEENLFGENAKYTWKGKGQENGTQIMLRYSENALTADKVYGGYTLMYSNVGLEGKWITEKFVGAGFIEFTKADGTKEYKIFTRHENYDENNAESVKNSCVRSCYEVAVAAYEDAETSQTLKDYLYEHYLKNNGYTPKEGN